MTPTSLLRYRLVGILVRRLSHVQGSGDVGAVSWE
jgi:hypothetical protein